jgi:phage terminase large subunit-like protein
LTVDYVYCDEEPPLDVYAELMSRLSATGGHFFMAFTPLKGLTPIVQEYWNSDSPDKYLVCMSIYEVDHIAKFPDKIAKIKSNYSGLSESEREARMMGIPAMGSGTVYPVSDEVLKCDAFAIPNTWKRIAGLDFGRGDHPIACVWLAFSPEGCCYVYDCFKLTRVGDAEVASQILSRGKWIPVAWPHDFVRSSGISTIGDVTKSEGWKYKEIYDKYGIEFTDTNAKTEEGSTRVEAGLVEVRQAMVAGQFRVFSHLSEWFKEKATYLYKEDGGVTKEKDDILDATRYGYIMRRYAVSEVESSGMYDSWRGFDSNKAIDNTLEKEW